MPAWGIVTSPGRLRFLWSPGSQQDEENQLQRLPAKLKHGLGKAAKRTEQAIYDAVVDLLPTVASTECANYFAHAGYART